VKNWRLGLALTVFVALLWGVLPIALKIVLKEMDAWSLTWFRFTFAALVVGAWLAARGDLPKFWTLPKRKLLLLLTCFAGLASNYILYLVGLDHITPATAQLVIQLGPILLAAGGALVYREKILRGQWIGFSAVTIGFLLFFEHRITELLGGFSNYAIGVALIIGAAIVWAVYAMAQKSLQGSLSTAGVLLVVYALSALVFVPFANFGTVSTLSPLAWWMFLFCCVNTVAAYGAFAESLRHWEASRASAVLALTPIITYFAMIPAAAVWTSHLQPEAADLSAYAGAITVVIGSVTASLAGRTRKS